MSLLRDPTIKLFGKTIPLPSPDVAASAPTELSADYSDAGEFAGDESSKEVEEVGHFDAKKHVVEVEADDHHGSALPGITDLEGSAKSGDQGDGATDGKTLKRPEKILPCPRCNSMETKFCYYNNYNVNQPRHFCKSCQRYWTAGGLMRNVPVGAGRRKSKSSGGSFCRQVLVNEAALQSNQCSDSNGILRFGSDAPLCDSMANVLDLAESGENCCEYRTGDQRIHMGSGDRGLSELNSGGSNLAENGSEAQDGMKKFQGYPLQVPCCPGPPWPIPWNLATPEPHSGLAVYPVQYWISAMMGSWIQRSSMSPPSTASPRSSLSSSPNSPTLGKHSRDGEMMSATNKSDGKAAPSEPKASRGIWIPKTLRIDDLSQAGRSSIWETLGIQNEKSSIKEGGIFDSFPLKNGSRGNYEVPERPCHLHTNPAALSRSQNFHETTTMEHTST